MSTEVYSISGDTLNGIVDPEKLQRDIQASSIVPTLSAVNTDGDVLNCVFDSALSAAEQTTLTGVVNAHDGQPIPATSSPQLVELNQIIKTDKPRGTDFLARVSPDYCDRTTWYEESVRVTGESLSGTGVGPYTSANGYWIDLTHGKVTREDDFSASYVPVIYDNGVEVTSGFTVDYDAGTVLFDSAPTGPVTADYSYENGGLWSVKPDTGKALIIKHAEIDFATDIQMKQIEFQIWAYNPFDLPNKVMVERTVYKNIKDIFKIANTVEKVDAMSGLSSPVIRCVFEYSQSIPLLDSAGMEIRFKVSDDTPMTGEWASITLYTEQEDEA